MVIVAIQSYNLWLWAVMDGKGDAQDIIVCGHRIKRAADRFSENYSSDLVRYHL